MSSLTIHSFSSSERELLESLLNIKIDPYKNYQTFYAAVCDIINSDKLPKSIIDFCEYVKVADLQKNTAFILKNCPTDFERPVFDITDPLTSKYQKKKTFISEAFLEVYARLCGNSCLGYKNINNGDHFHDVYPMKSLLKSQSQKSLVTLGFHNDLPNNIARPDWVNILCLRSYECNRVSTTIIRNIDIIQSLPSEVKAILQKPIFTTPQEVISVFGGKDDKEFEKKAIYFEGEDIPLSYFETRTKASNDEGQFAIDELDKVLHRVKQRVFLNENDFISIANNCCLHAREVIHLENKQRHAERWLQKTFNVNNIDIFNKYMVKDKFRVIDE